MSSVRIGWGIGTRDAVYHTLESAKALRAMARPEYDKERARQASKQCLTALIRGSQFAADVSP